MVQSICLKSENRLTRRLFLKRELSSAGSEHLPYKQRVTGSNPVVPTLKMKGLQKCSPFSFYTFAHNLHTKIQKMQQQPSDSGEAMLSMHADHRKAEIIREANRLLKPGGLYGIHELGLMPDTIDDATKAEIQRQLAVSLKVNARPLTQAEWIVLIEQQGFKVRKVMTNPMHLLEPKRIIEDEGLLRTIGIGFNIVTHPKVAKRILAMRAAFINIIG